MIFLTVGTHRQQFDRLLKEIDRLLEKAEVKEEVFAQTGNCSYIPVNYGHKSFMTDTRYRMMMKGADVIVTHGGAGSVINAMKEGKKIIIVPRLEKFGEHTNDHQLELARALDRSGKAVMVKDTAKLGDALRKIKRFRPEQSDSRKGLIKAVSEYIKAEGAA
jgi:UDP-N-acetylglucosamine transferase subunit ALG13